jgi:uncharacterized protein (DUF3820 family)
MPWGKYRGCRIRLLPDAYLSWLSGWTVLRSPKWKWLHDSLLAELKFRGLRADLADTAEPQSSPVDAPIRPIKTQRAVDLP